MGRIFRTYSQHDLREKSVLFRSVQHFLKGTIRENMKWGREDATDEEIWDALTTAQAREIVERVKTDSLISNWNRMAEIFPAVSVSDLQLPVPS